MRVTLSLLNIRVKRPQNLWGVIERDGDWKCLGFGTFPVYPARLPGYCLIAVALVDNSGFEFP